MIHTGTKTTPIHGDVAFNDVSFFYPQRKDFKVLDHLTFSAKKGEKIAFVGASGAGKSTIASILQRFYSPTSGTYTIDGTDVSEIGRASCRERGRSWEGEGG